MSKSATGHCYCGAVRFEVSGDPLWVSHCHCESCRRHTGSVITTTAGYYRDQLSHKASLPASTVTDDGVKRSFCGTCGSPISYESTHERYQNQVYLYLGIFDQPEKIQPQDHVFYAERVSWFHVGDNLPKHEDDGHDRD